MRLDLTEKKDIQAVRSCGAGCDPCSPKGNEKSESLSQEDYPEILGVKKKIIMRVLIIHKLLEPYRLDLFSALGEIPEFELSVIH